MTIRELIDELEYAAEVAGEYTEVRYASQPAWPFENSIDSVVALSSETREENARSEMRYSGMTEEEINQKLATEEIEATENVVYLEEGVQLGYLPGEAKEALGW